MEQSIQVRQEQAVVPVAITSVTDCLRSLVDNGAAPEVQAGILQYADTLDTRLTNTVKYKFNENYPSLHEMSIQNREQTIAIVTLLLVDAFGNMSQGKCLSPRQITRIATIIVDEYNDLDIPAIHSFCNLMQMGRLGKSYGSMGSDTICEWLDKFYSMYWEEFENLASREHELNCSNARDMLTDEQLDRLYHPEKYKKEPIETEKQKIIRIRNATIQSHKDLLVQGNFQELKTLIENALISEGIFQYENI